MATGASTADAAVLLVDVRDEVLAFARPLGFATLDILPGSALRGDMVVARGPELDWFEGPTLLERLESLDSAADLAAAGDLIVDPRSAPREARALEATLVWLDADPMHASGRYLVHQAGRRTLARIKEVASRRDVHTLEERPTDGSIGTNDIVRAKLALQSPLFVDSYDAVRATGSFILIDEATNRTVAAGMVR